MDFREDFLSGIAAAALSLVCGGCVGWTLALAADLAHPSVGERPAVSSPAPEPRNVTGY